MQDAARFSFMREGEVNFDRLDQEGRRKFNESDQKEWQNILRMNAVRVVTGEEARAVKREHGDRVIDSRMVRRWKPVKGQAEVTYVAKSRWCVLGHQYSDVSVMGNPAYAPTPSNDSIMIFLASAASLHAGILSVSLP